MQPSTGVMLLSHRPCDATLARYEALRRDLPPERYDVVLVLSEPCARAAEACGVADWIVLDRPAIFLPEYPAKGSSGRVVPGNWDLCILAFWRQRPRYRHYWYVEFDVFFAGGAGVLAEMDAASEADLILPRGIGKRDDGWFHWPSVTFPDGDAPPPERQLHGLASLHRASARLLAALDSAYRRGWAGHGEAMIPTIASAHGMEIEIMSGIGTRLRGRPFADLRSFAAQVCEWRGPDMIHHPVKSLEAEARLLAGEALDKRRG